MVWLYDESTSELFGVLVWGGAGFRVLGFRLRWLRVQVVGFLGYFINVKGKLKHHKL